MAQYNQLALICTGFHRSATSVMANYLENAGLDLGADLMAGGISNPKGHFEDWPAVNLHDSFLQQSGTNWQFHDEVDLVTSTEPIRKYIEQRNNISNHWGLKDPRACLFLNEWQRELGENGKFLLVIRHWSSCIESLLHRHSREFAHQLPRLNNDNVELQLWLHPELIAKMWFCYNKRLLAFAKTHPDKVLLVTQRSLFLGVPLISTLNKKFGFSLNTNTSPPFQAELLRDKANIRVFDSLSYALKNKLDDMWQALLALADFKTEDEAPVYIKTPGTEENVFAHYQQAIKKNRQLDVVVPEIQTEIGSKWLHDLKMLTEIDESIKHLDKATQTALSRVDINALLTLIDQRYSVNGQLLLSTAKLLMRLNQHTLALSYFQKSITVGSYHPYIDMLIGQCYQQLFKYNEALFFFNKAITHNPNNPIFYTKKARCLIALDKNQNAEMAFKKSLEEGAKNPACVLPYCEFLLKKTRKDEAIVLLNTLEFEIRHPAATHMLTSIKLSTNFTLGKASYLEHIKATLYDKDKMQWLAQTGQLINNGNSESDFILRINGHWAELDKSIQDK